MSWNCSADGCRYVLRCAVHTPGVTSFVWSHGEQLDAEEPELVVEKELPPGELDVLSRTCTVRNPVSSRNVTVSPAAVCTGESPQRIQGWGLGDTGRDGMHPDPSWVPLRLSESRGSAAPPGVGGFAEALTSLPCPCSLPHAALPENTTHSAATGELPCCPVHIHVLSPSVTGCPSQRCRHRAAPTLRWRPGSLRPERFISSCSLLGGGNIQAFWASSASVHCLCYLRKFGGGSLGQCPNVPAWDWSRELLMQRGGRAREVQEQSRLSLCNASPPASLAPRPREIRAPAEQGRAERGSEESCAPFPRV